jgi:outer membrane protein assembly factor BamB
MGSVQTEGPSPRRPLRLWPGVLVVALQWLAWLVVPLVAAGPIASYSMALGSLLGGVAIVVWWLFLSRAAWVERLGAPALMVAGMAVTRRFAHPSIATAEMGMLLFMYAIPVLCLAFVTWAVASRWLGDGLRRLSMVATILVACGAWTLVRTSGITGDGRAELAWRFSATPEERLLARAGAEPPPASAPSAPTEAPALAGEKPATASAAPEAAAVPQQDLPAPVWPGFRGPHRDGVVRGVRIQTNWKASPPVELWRRPIGPGWSSFAADGQRLYTQEQRGDDEVVSCYALGTGAAEWKHRDRVRFWEANAGAGPRGTPTLAEGRLYALGATGILNVLDSATGTVVWSRNAAADTETKVPDWGFSSSPLVVGDELIAAAAGRLIAYDLATGEPRWLGPAGDGGYASPHLLTIDGVAQVLLLSESGVRSLAPADGTVLWEHAWRGFASLQPALTGDGDLLITTSGEAGGLGTRRLAVAHASGAWTAEERWTSIGLKPYFNDLVVHRGHAFGFDGRILSCIDLRDGQRRWKGGRYGHGQLVLLAD